MAKQMPFTGPDGVTHPSSYWRPVQVSLSPATKTARAVFAGYHDKACREAGKAPVMQKAYDVPADRYDAYFGVAALDAKNPLESAYALADDTLEGPPPAKGKKDTRTSFFDGAKDA